MKNYHIVKSCRSWDGRGYCGPTSYNIPMEFYSIFGAKMYLKILNKRNPVGWEIVEVETSKVVCYV